MWPTINLGAFSIPTFFCVVSLIGLFSFWYSQTRARDRQLDSHLILDLHLILFLAGLVGARGFHCLFEYPEIYMNSPIEILKLWKGGYVFYGGLISSFLAGLLFLKIRRRWDLVPVVLELYAPIVAFAYSLGRLGCLLEGCCYGKHCDLPWAIAGRHPTQVYALVWEALLFCMLIYIENSRFKIHLLKQGINLFFIWSIFHSIGRLVNELFRDDFRGPMYLISVSSWISILIFLGSIIAIKMKIFSPLKT